MARPSSPARSTAMLCLPCSDLAAPASGNPMIIRIGSPARDSTFMTRAPKSARIAPAKGAA